MRCMRGGWSWRRRRSEGGEKDKNDKGKKTPKKKDKERLAQHAAPLQGKGGDAP